jgi:DNA polymerase elongation subunit (family B)
MSKDTFYTSVFQNYDQILVRGYREGIPFKEKIDFSPSLFIECEGGEYTDITGEIPLKEKVFESASSMKDYLKTMSGVYGHRYYGTENVIRQYISKNYEGEISWTPDTAQLWFFDIETKVGEGINYREVESLKKYKPVAENCIILEDGTELLVELVSRDSIVWDHKLDSNVEFERSCYANKGFPTPADAYEEITLISFFNARTDKGYIYSTLKATENNKAILEGADFKYFDTEKELLKHVIMFFQTHQIDILSGWNSEFFDVPYVINRCKRVLGEAITNLISPWKKLVERKATVNDKEVITYDIVGICHLDYLELYKKFNPGSQESFKLDYIADLELGTGKVENPYDTFKEFYLKDPDLFIYYNWIDSRLLRDLEAKMQLVTLAMMIAFMSKVNIDDVHSSMRVWESIIYNHFRDMGRYMWANEPRKISRSIPGAYVHPPVPGKYLWGVSIDATSLYPSIMMQNNISPDTKFGKLDITPEDILAGNIPDFDSSIHILSGNGVLTTKDKEGYIPYLVRQKFDQRKAFKKQMLTYEKEAQAIRDELKRRGVDVH